jgi:hypothetical protein
MTSWWEFGEHSGYEGNALALFRVVCAFCNAKGNFERVHHAQKKHPATEKILNFDTFKCGNCGNFIMIFWSAAEFGGSHGIHNFNTVPWAGKSRNSLNIGPTMLGAIGCRPSAALKGKIGMPHP